MRRKQRDKKNKSEVNDNGWNKTNCPYDVVVKENAMFEKYYRQLNLVETKEEFDEMLAVLQKPLPITFRITSYKSFSTEILHILKEKHFKYLDSIFREENAQLIASASQKQSTLLKNDSTKLPCELVCDKIYENLSWYPNEMGWQIQISKADVRKNAYFQSFKLFLVNQTESGNLCRQEAVSMIPPLLLDIKSHHKILDMCASPGSKTAQLIEMLHSDKSNPTPEGFVIANDLDNKRCYMLMHQLKRLESPNFMIINHDASTLPNMRGGEKNNVNIMYDRILADVPCSGDGTFRKNIDIWAKWNFAHAANLHGIQARIANRAVELLKPGGLMVYSTCSLNPVENEAVVANLLLKFKGQLELVDERHKLTGMKTAKGVYTWNVMTKTGDIFNNVKEVTAPFINLFRENLFPPELSVAKELGLEKCIRVLPHHQNTGGFFIAVLRKLPLVGKAEKAEKEKRTAEYTEKEEIDLVENSPPEADESRQMKCPAAKRHKHSFEENPFKFIEQNEALTRDWPKIKKFFKINDDFPVDQMLTRNKPGENVRTIYFVSKQIRELTINNGDRIKFINMGVPLFSRADIKDPSNVELRVSQESLDIVHKYFKCRTIKVTVREDLIKLLTQSTPLISEFTTELQEEIKVASNHQNGSLVVVWKRPQDDENNLPISFTTWLGKVSLRPFIKIDARKFFLTLIGMDTEEIEEAAKKLKAEDEMNSKKSMETNPCSKFYTGPKEMYTGPKIDGDEKMEQSEDMKHEDEIKNELESNN